MKENLEKFINLFWLRPENAVLTAVQAEILGKYIPKGVSADIGCGDGIYTFAVFGGEFDSEFDVFASVGQLNKVKSSNADMFNHFDSTYKPLIRRSSDYKIDYGIDIKKNLLEKASKLGIYKKLLESNVCDSLPLNRETLDTVYLLNTINHYEDSGKFLQSLYQMMKKGGRCYISVYSPSFTDLYSAFDNMFPEEWNRMIERGMRSIWPSLYSFGEWGKLFEECGFHLNDTIPMVSEKFIPVWNIGLRPLAPALVKMANMLKSDNPAGYREVKEEWCEIIYRLALPFCELAADIKEAATCMFILEKE